MHIVQSYPLLTVYQQGKTISPKPTNQWLCFERLRTNYFCAVFVCSHPMCLWREIQGTRYFFDRVAWIKLQRQCLITILVSLSAIESRESSMQVILSRRVISWARGLEIGKDLTPLSSCSSIASIDVFSDVRTFLYSTVLISFSSTTHESVSKWPTAFNWTPYILCKRTGKRTRCVRLYSLMLSM